MGNGTAHLAVYDGYAEMEVGHLLAELRTGRFTGRPFEIVTVAESSEPIRTMGGVRVAPDALLSELDPGQSELLVPRLIAAAALVVWGARTHNPWTIAVAGWLALPVIWINAWVILLAVIRLRQPQWGDPDVART